MTKSDFDERYPNRDPRWREHWDIQEKINKISREHDAYNNKKDLGAFESCK